MARPSDAGGLLISLRYVIDKDLLGWVILQRKTHSRAESNKMIRLS